MTLETRLEVVGLTLTAAAERRIRHQLRTLDHHFLASRPAPHAVLVLRQHAAQRQVEANLQVQLGPLAGHVVSHQTAETADHAVRLAVADLERQLEHRRAFQQGEPTYGVPSRRLPAHLRPHPFVQPSPEPEERATEDQPT
jgi:ribosome-associated translation inhibitor RaiA